MNEYEERNRAMKATKLVQLAERQGLTADELAEHPNLWRPLAAAARVNPPSERTRAMVVRILRVRAGGEVEA